MFSLHKRKLEPKPVCPLVIDQIVSLVSDLVTARVDSIRQSNYSECIWVAYVSANVQVPADALEFSANPITDADGNVQGFEIRYSTATKVFVQPIDRGDWHFESGEGKSKAICIAYIQSIEMEKK